MTASVLNQKRFKKNNADFSSTTQNMQNIWGKPPFQATGWQVSDDDENLKLSAYFVSVIDAGGSGSVKEC